MSIRALLSDQYPNKDQ